MHLVNFYLTISTAHICSVFMHVNITEVSHIELEFSKEMTVTRWGSCKLQNLVSSGPRETEGEVAASLFAANITLEGLEKKLFKNDELGAKVWLPVVPQALGCWLFEVLQAVFLWEISRERI